MNTGTATRPVRTVPAELRRLRAELAAVTAQRDQLAALAAARLAADPAERQERLWRGYAADSYTAGYAAGHRDGREDMAAELDRAWNAAAAGIARGGPTHADTERARWELRGQLRTRETFADPHPTDYPGQAPR